eukprot:CAMPEP_0205801336 /NCGR_PEP_ID=MMETSP0205-20121125/3291_1 /ASSEMBLY_ACC=CAM_ASM_000278 /TAXON_ID=36767 /ORGANISM="Euplotes focardii, Strain TN1" /LENGTH=210 /DNA_ID=CAMNT_0053065915 /DNA_START=84 /DNA_END=713 /DNA_ORIENTATION=+
MTTRQSPIDIETSTTHDEKEIKVSSSFKNIMNGTITLDGRFLLHEYEGGHLEFFNYTKISEWKSIQFHFHSPSEHTINGKYYDAEMHMVFQGITHESELAVVGLLFEVDDSVEKDLFLENLQLDNLQKDQVEQNGIKASPSKLYGKLVNRNSFHYQGGLTTPGYDETINWFVYEQALKIPTEQFKVLESFWKNSHIEGCVKGNARELQDT